MPTTDRHRLQPPGSAARRAAVITGGARGIGLGISRELARDGWDLLLSGQRSASEVAPVVDELRGLGSRVEYIAGNIADAGARAAIVDRAHESYGAVHALVNNAGRAPRVRADLIDASEESFEEVLRTNLQGPYFLTQAIARGMLERARVDLPVTLQFLSDDVRPGIITTDMTSAVKDTYDRRIADGLVPEGRWGQPDDVGRVVRALLRGDLPYSTGSVINLDGGLSIARL